MHEQIRRYIQTGFAPDEWQLIGLNHPVIRLYLKGHRADGDRLLRDFTAAHEAGHCLMAKHVGVDVRRVVIGHLHEIPGGSTLGFTEYRVHKRRDPIGEALLNLAGICGHAVVYGDEWALDQAAWTAPEDTSTLRDEARNAGGDAWEVRELIRPIILRGEPFLGQSTVGGAMLAALDHAEQILLGYRGRLLRLAGHLIQYGQADRSVIDQIAALPE
jgi:hypothetical protein